MPFPRFDDGDVEIRLTAEKKPLLLHSWVLALHSPWFKASLSRQWAGKKNSRKYELRFDKGQDTGWLVSQPPAESELAAHPSVSTEHSMAHRHEDPAYDLYERRLRVVAAHEDILGTLYHVGPAALREWRHGVSRGLVELHISIADYYACLPITTVHVDNFLHRNSTEVLKECRYHSLAMLKLGMSAKFTWIVTEACIYFIGKSKSDYDRLRPQVAELGIAELIDAKRGVLAQRMRETDFALLSLNFPPRTNVTNMQQIALNVFRQVLINSPYSRSAQHFARDYAWIYRSIDDGKLGYRDSDVDRHFARPGDYYSVRDDFEYAMRNVLDLAKQVLEPISENRTQLREECDYYENLLCVGVDEDELPWNCEQSECCSSKPK